MRYTPSPGDARRPVARLTTLDGEAWGIAPSRFVSVSPRENGGSVVRHTASALTGSIKQADVSESVDEVLDAVGRADDALMRECLDEAMVVGPKQLLTDYRTDEVERAFRSLWMLNPALMSVPLLAATLLGQQLRSRDTSDTRAMRLDPDLALRMRELWLKERDIYGE